MPRPHQLLELRVGDMPTAWSSAGFTVDDDIVVIDGVRIALVGSLGRRGIISAAIAGAGDAIDGLGIHSPAPDHRSRPSPRPTGSAHPNGVTTIDHVVVATGDCDRTTAALQSMGIETRRTRQFDLAGIAQRQTFFWLGDVILELVGPAAPSAGAGPAEYWGLALQSADLDTTAAELGDRCTPPKSAVQPGRRITTIKTRDLGISTALAIMSPH